MSEHEFMQLELELAYDNVKKTGAYNKASHLKISLLI